LAKDEKEKKCNFILGVAAIPVGYFKKVHSAQKMLQTKNCLFSFITIRFF